MRVSWLCSFLLLAACGQRRDVEGRSTASASLSAPPPPVAVTEADPTLAPPKPAVALEAPPRCEPAGEVDLFASPVIPTSRGTLRILATSSRPVRGELRLAPASGAPNPAANAALQVTSTSARRGGPPYFWLLEVPAPRGGAYVASFTQAACPDGANVTTKKVSVSNGTPRATAAPPEAGVWATRASWTRSRENVYSAWVEHLFDAKDGEMPSWRALEEVLRDRSRNLLHDHLGAGEDSSSAPPLRADCADLPYFLRAYFAYKIGLPFAVGTCNRGGAGAPPSCEGIVTNEDEDARARAAAARKTTPAEASVASFGAFVRGTLADKAHSGSARAPFDDPASDYYPVALTWEALRPGTVFADPYGHVLMVARRVAQTDAHGGMLIAVDGQPDGTVATKRYWRGNFLYATGRELGGPGWKRFRPIARRGTALERLDDAAISGSEAYADLSRAGSDLDVEGFYDRMDDVLSPRPLDPDRAMREAIDALDEQVRTRVTSVDNGRRWLASAKAVAEMPEGASIFETAGPWEDFSTPSRDLRLLIAIDVVRGFPARVARRSERYAMPPGKTAEEIATALRATLEHELAARKVTYTRSDGSTYALTLAEVLGRASALELAYNPNDCVEVRWGAPEGSEEAKTCGARAPSEQRARMDTYRAWFRERRRPPRS